MSGVLEERAGDYALRGDYHRCLDPSWSYAPIYRRKIAWLDGVMSEVEKNARILDVGAGEGAIVDRYRQRGQDIVGVDLQYSGAHVRRADLRALP
ncbi:MAG TPA: hypothetical protein VEK15_30730, partial [Vicinamibacteria bacterium]|nr:hypothetical protein [Vicinamibacteria bacterium]